MEDRLVPYEAVKRIGADRVLILAPHPDDEVFGCGGALATHVAHGDPVDVVVLTNGELGGGGTEKEDLISIRQSESVAAARVLGYGVPTFWGLRDRGLEYGEFLVRRIVEFLVQSRADLVYAPSIFEMHPDHRAVGMAALEAVRRVGEGVRLAMYEVGIPLPRLNLLLDISDAWESKLRAMVCFPSQLRNQAYDQQITALNRFRTYTLGAGIQAAEAYLVVSADALQRDTLRVYESEYQRQRRLGIPLLPADKPLVSVLVRSMNRASLMRALDSVALQTYPNLEVVVANAAGGEHAPLGETCGRFPLSLVNAGKALPRSQAANFALDKAAGKFLIFLDDDDWFEPDHVSRLVESLSLAQPGILVAYANARVVGVDGEPREHVFRSDFNPTRLMADNYLPIHTVLFDRRLLELGCCFDENLDVYEDWDFWLQISKHTDFLHVDFDGAIYSMQGNSSVGLQGDQVEKTRARERFFDKWKVQWTGKQIDGLLSFKDSLVIRAGQELVPVVDALRVQIDADRRAQEQIVSELRAQSQAIAEELAASLSKCRASEDTVGALLIELNAQKSRAVELESKAVALESKAEQLSSKATELTSRLDEMLRSTSWRVTFPLRWVGLKILRVRHMLHLCLRYLEANGGGLVGVSRLTGKVLRALIAHGPRGVLFKIKAYARFTEGIGMSPISLESTAEIGFTQRQPVIGHISSVDVIVCVHNALQDVKRCLESVVRHTYPPYSLIIVNDGSNEETSSFLSSFALGQGARLIHNINAQGYTLAANQGLRASSADYVVLLNSDTVVSAQWLDRMIMCAEKYPSVGMVGPLSNTASWQSVPKVLIDGDWADNDLPEGMSLETMAALVAANSARLYPHIPLLNGFCLLIKRKLIDAIGLFDEEAFGKGYGEENDYCLRAGKAGWSLALADDVYVFHAQSKSYSHERRKLLSQRAGEVLANKHGQPLIDECVGFCANDRVLGGLRARVRWMLRDYRLRDSRDPAWEGKRVLFFLNTADRGGGTNVIVSESRALISMGIDVAFVNYASNRSAFEFNYSTCGVPRIYIADNSELCSVLADCDAIVATLNTSVEPISIAIRGMPRQPVVGYYIQDFEPDFYPPESTGYRGALASYGLIEGIVRVTKTEWNRRILKERTGLDSTVIGASYDCSLFRPRPRTEASWPGRPLRIVAMIRPYTPRRAPRLTMVVLREVSRKYGDRVEIVLFGEETDHPDFQKLPLDFQWDNRGKQSDVQLARLFNESDIFVDFSEYQAMGLTAMEAMACGVAVVIPENGGADSFAIHDRNSVFVDSANQRACVEALCHLIDDNAHRFAIQTQAIADVPEFSPNLAAHKLMQAIFPANE